MDCYNIIDEPEDGDPHDIYILEYKGSREVEVWGFSNDKCLKPLKLKKKESE